MTQNKAKRAYEANSVGRPRIPKHLQKVPMSASVSQQCKANWGELKIKPGEVLEQYYQNAIESNLSGKSYRA
jgi:hypothetical protein